MWGEPGSSTEPDPAVKLQGIIYMRMSLIGNSVFGYFRKRKQPISNSNEELSSILHQKMVAEQKTEQIKKEGGAIRQEGKSYPKMRNLEKSA